jgi:hypothetical protein
MMLVAALLACGAGKSDAGEVAALADPGWRLDTVWDDGQAEVCDYEVLWARYGRHYPGRARLILVKEPWAPDLEVKADHPRPDGFEVLKLNHSRDVPTGAYTYRQMASVFLRRDDGSLRKLATSSIEDCGVSTGFMVDARLEIRSYFDGVGEQTLPWPQEAISEDGLAASLRDFVASQEIPPALLVFPTLLDSRLDDLNPRRLALARRPAGEVESPGGESVSAVELVLDGVGHTLTYLFEAAPPHRLLAHSTGQGTRYRLLGCQRVAYWERNTPEDQLMVEGVWE